MAVESGHPPTGVRPPRNHPWEFGGPASIEPPRRSGASVLCASGEAAAVNGRRWHRRLRCPCTGMRWSEGTRAPRIQGISRPGREIGPHLRVA